MSELVEGVRRSMIGRYPLVYLRTWDEERAVRLLESVSARIQPNKELPLVRWSCVSGFDDEDGEPTIDPVAAVQRVCASDEPGLFVMHDLGSYFDRPELVRALREAYQRLRRSDRQIYLTSPVLHLPPTLSKEVLLVEIGLPDTDELERLVQGYVQRYREVIEAEIDDQLVTDMAFGLRGLTLNEARHTLNRIFRTRRLSRPQMLAEIFKDKETLVRKSGFLDYVPPQANMGSIGGLDNLKDWLLRRQKLFSNDAIEQGMPTPKGMLVMGMSGCGKSLAAKAVSALWGVPLFKLDMNLVMSGVHGSPEAAFDRALRTIEALAPAVLWIDEIENALGMDHESSDSNPRIFSSFLTWMQEKPPLIFVAATANRISALPAEVIRKGRFDQVFFVDLPTPDERQQIFAIHLKRNGAEPEDFDLELLGIATRGWNGAEIEQAVDAARIDAYNEARDFTMEDITRNTGLTVPLSKTMHEQMKRIRGWAFGRATLASKEKYSETESVALG